MSASLPSQATGNSSHTARYFSLFPNSKYLKTHQWWCDGLGHIGFCPGESCFLLKACIGRRKENRKSFFCFGNWVWYVSLSKCYLFKHFRGKSVLPASISVMKRAMFSPASLLRDEKMTCRSLRLKRVEDESALNFCANWGCLCRIRQLADISFSLRFGFEMDLGLQ